MLAMAVAHQGGIELDTITCVAELGAVIRVGRSGDLDILLKLDY
jgi:hypothetical protein